MPSIDYHGKWFVFARSTARGSTGAVRFPIKCSTLSTAERFANAEVLRSLPGWAIGVVTLSRAGKQVKSWVLRRD